MIDFAVFHWWSETTDQNRPTKNLDLVSPECWKSHVEGDVFHGMNAGMEERKKQSSGKTKTSNERRASTMAGNKQYHRFATPYQQLSIQTIMAKILLLTLFVVAQCVSPAASFVAQAGRVALSTSLKVASAESSTADDLLKPDYEIEPISIRIGHGFDIHRMAPVEEAGQPVVIGGVEIPHKDQKVCAIQKMQIR